MKQLRAFARAFALVSLLSSAIGLIALHRAHAATSELVLQTGAAMLAYEGATNDEPPSVLHINGAPLFIRSGATVDSVERVIATYAARCRARPLIADLPGMLRLGSTNEAFLACLEPERELDSIADLAERFTQALDRGDLAPLGELRLVWAISSEQGARYALVWSDGGLPWDAMFPERGDAPGAELSGVPRPQNTRRMLAIGHEPGAAALAAYASALPFEETAQRYAAQLRKARFDVARVPSDETTAATLHLTRGAYAAIAFVSEDGPHASHVTLVALDKLDADDATAVLHAR